MKTIQLTQGKVALVDDSDFEALSQFKWAATHFQGHWAAARSGRRHDGTRDPLIYMHRQIMGFPPGEVDHRDRNALNNQRENLRCATRSQQTANSRKPNKTGFRGIQRTHRGPGYGAKIKFEGKRHCLGTFATAEAAARAYDAAARKFYGEFAVLNFPGGAS